MRKLILFFLITLSGLFYSSDSYSTHVYGGDIRYAYVKDTLIGSQTFFVYGVRLTMYMDCSSSSIFVSNPNAATPPATPLQIYEDTLNPSSLVNPVQTIQLFLNAADSGKLNDSLPPNCSQGNFCMWKVVYDGIAVLAPTFKGYHFVYDNCCRTSSVRNINPTSTAGGRGPGSLFHTWMATTALRNSSPVFTDFQQPSYCVAEESVVANLAFDIDNNKLAFERYTPFDGEGVQANPPYGGNYTTWPPRTVVFNNSQGYTDNQPLGSGGVASINAITGSSKIKSTTQGNYVLGYQVKELDANNNVIGLVRREFQFPIVSCSDDTNDAPVLQIPTSKTFSVDAGDKLEFDIKFEDPNGDPITGGYQVNGLIFDTNFTKPAATLSAPFVLNDSLTQTFSWTPSCDQASDVPYRFQILVRDFGCVPKSFIAEFEVEVSPPPVPSAINGKQSLCANSKGEVYSVTNIPNTTYIWDVTNGNIVSGDSTSAITVDWGNSGGAIKVYTVTKNACKSDSVIISVQNTTFPIDAGNNDTVCALDSITLGGNPTGPTGFTFNWTPNTYFVNSADTNQPNPAIRPLTTTTYFLKVTDTSGLCVMFDTVKITVRTITNAFAGPDDTICGGDTAVLTATGGDLYRWIPGAFVVDSTSDTTSTIPLTDSVAFIVIITDTRLNCSAVDTQIVTVHSKATVTAGRDTNICQGDTFRLGGNPTGPPGSAYKWNTQSGISDSTVANPIYTANAPDTATYILEIVTPAGCTILDTVNVRKDSIPSLRIAFSDTVLCPGDTVFLADSTIPLRPLTYLWNKNLFLPGGGTGNNLNAGFDMPDSTTTYALKVTDPGTKCFNTDTLVVKVNPKPEITLPFDTAFLCLGDSISLTATKGAKRYKWTPNLNLIPNDSVDSVNVKPNITTTYFLQADSLGNCSSRDSIVIEVSNTVPVDIGPDISVCIGDTFVLAVDSSKLTSKSTYLWTPVSNVTSPNKSSTRAFTDSQRDFFLQVNNASCVGRDTITVSLKTLPNAEAGQGITICNGQIATLFARGGDNYLWQPSALVTDSTDSNTTTLPLSSTTQFIVLITDTTIGCSVRDTQLVTVSSASPINAGSDVFGCSGASYQLQATGGTSYLWTPNTGLNNDTIANPIATVLDTTTYIVKDTSGACPGEDTVTVFVLPAPKVDAGDTIISCDADTVRLGGNPTGPPGSLYAWSSPEVLDHPDSANPTSFFTLNRIYTVIVVDSNGCEGIDSVAVLRYSVSATAEEVDCTKDSVKLDVVNVDGVPPYQYLWSPNYQLSSTTVKSPNARPDSTITYTVRVTDSLGCTDSVRVTVPIIDQVKATFTVDVRASCDDAVVTTNNTSTNSTQYKWYVGDKEISDDFNVRIPLEFNSKKKITLLALNGEGCRDSASVSQDVLAFADYFDGRVPNVFTPNGDGINDVFDPQLGQRLEQCSEVRIFNRWGQLMFESRGNSHKWDGRTFAGEECAAGVYFYVLDVNGTTYKGHLTLIRD